MINKNQQYSAELESFIIRLAHTAGEVIKPFFRHHVAIENKLEDGFDPVTKADREAEIAMRALITEHYPQHGIWGEEQGRTFGSSNLTWVLDPIDGTRSFISGILQWGVLIALYDGSEVILGAMYQPITDELFLGTPAGSSYISAGVSQPMLTRSCPQLSLATIGCTTPEMFTNDAEKQAFSDLTKKSRLVRYGGDCYNYGLLAMGFIDLCVESSLQAYDIQALIPVIEQAGGRVSTWNGGDPCAGGQIIASGDPKLHELALQVLAPGVNRQL